jgi:hypothetical protein
MRKKYILFESKLSLIISVLIHGIAFLTFILFEFRFIMTDEPVYLEIIFDEVILGNQEEEGETEQGNIEEAGSEEINKIFSPDTLVNKDNYFEKWNESRLYKSEIKPAEPSEKERRHMYLKYARSLLDSFLVTYPEFSSLILKQQAKDLTENKNSRLSLEDKITRDIYLYLKDRYPEGGEHEMNNYTSPGIQIPIGDLINLIKDLF